MSNKSTREHFGFRHKESSSLYTTLSSKYQKVSSIKNQEETPFYLKLSSGAVAGMFGTTVVFPIDLVKTRLQTQSHSLVYKSGLDCLFKVLRTEGFRGMYRGLQPNLIGIAPEKAIKLAVNDGMRHYFSRSLGISESELPMKYGMISGATAGLCQVIATNPMEVVKIQMQLAGASGGSPKSLVNVVQQLGIKGLYHGASATLCRDIPFSIIFFSSFSLFKSFFTNDASTQPSLPKVFLSGILAAGVGALFATPMDVVKTRIQASIHSHGIFEIMNHSKQSSLLNFYMKIIRNEGYLALMKGAPQVCLMVAPLLGTSIFVYELQQRLIKRFV